MSSENETARCRSCNAPITFVLTPKGMQMPIDKAISETGNVWIEDGVARVGKPPPDVARYTSHFATCPAAAKHRRKK